MIDQLSGVRELVGRRVAPAEPMAGTSTAMPKTLAITSGKGGVGKTNVALNLSLALSKLKQRVLLLDADLGLANVDLLAGVHPSLHLGHVIANECRMRDILYPLYPNLTLIPGRSGLAELADLDPWTLEQLLQEMAALESHYDFLIIDTAAGISRQVTALVRNSQRALLVTTPEPTAFMDAYATLKVCCGSHNTGVVVNMCQHQRDGFTTFSKLRTLGREFLKKEIDFWGSLDFDPALKQCVREQTPMLLRRETSAFSQTMVQLARRLVGAPAPAPSRGFFRNLFRRAESGAGA
jgi:flagellar biosynthesis protein FlhG